MKKVKRNKKRIRYKLIIYLFIIYVSFAYTFYNIVKANKKITNEEFISLLVKGGNINLINDYKVTYIVNKSIKLFMGIDFRRPSSIINKTILGINGKKEIISLSYNDDYSNMEQLKEVSEYISDPNPSNNDEPIIYLYNSHQLENYNNDNLDIYGVTPNVLMASYLFKEKLNNNGLMTIVEDANMSEILNNNNWEYYKSYDVSRNLILDKISKYPSLKYFIDIHRDSQRKEMTTVDINGTSYAKVLFVIGKDYSTWQDNYNFADKLNEILNKKYKGLSRGIITKSGIDVNGVYNQDLNSNIILIEVGGVDNNIEEVNNTVDALAMALCEEIKK